MQSNSCSSFSHEFKYDVFISFRGSGFTGNLYKALSDNGIRTFIDDKELQRGDKITPSLLKNIEDSRIAIIVFSSNYAASSFCLDELVHIINYFKEKSRLVLPVFYDTEPSQVRQQNNRYGEALADYEKRFQNNKEKMERLQKWKMALTYAADLSGYHYNFRKEEYEYIFINKIVTEISSMINRVLLHVADHPVGLKSQLQQVKSLLDVDSDKGVCLIGIYGSGGLGKTTLTRAVYNMVADQFEVGDLGWLGLGSRVIITTREKYLLSCHEIKRTYEVDGLNEKEALELFRWMAFKWCEYTQVQEILHAHYGHCIKSHAGVLVDKSLIKINVYGYVTLHDLIENMGKEIVRQESPKEPEKRSRLWFHDDIVHVLKENTGTRKIEMIHLNFPSTERIIDWNGEAFEKMIKLKTLIIENGHFSKGARYLPSSLRVLKWNSYHLESLSSMLLNKMFEYMNVLTFNDFRLGFLINLKP
ncbi:unnamed protein product [Vicia faba]|uniref:TIR domain-containing protein n=1 Tax=Vicia faba TaxID=3906 RepID=A0AAV0ZBD9_VICFA|nr:unnamed protein product [Vicia faba]